MERLKRYEEAEQIQKEVLELRRRLLGDENPDTRNTKLALARLLRRRGKGDEAEALTGDTKGSV